MSTKTMRMLRWYVSTKVCSVVQLIVFASFIFNVYAQIPPFKETCVQGTYPPNQSHHIKEYVINLDLPPKERWTLLASEKKQEELSGLDLHCLQSCLNPLPHSDVILCLCSRQRAIRAVLAEFKNFLYNFGTVTEELVYFLDLLGPQLNELLPEPYQDEIKGISNATGLEVGEIALYNIFYELFTVCTSVIAQDPSGKLYHARNLDFGLFMGWDVHNRTWEITEVLRPTVVNLNFQRGGNTVFKSVNFAGFIGILTAVAPGKFTFSLNERFNINGGYMGIIEKIKNGKGAWMSFLTRRLMETAQSYEEAKHVLMSTQLIAPVYFILGGNNSKQAVVITRNRHVNNTDVWTIGDKDAGTWYILETNYDHWSAPFFVDDRRTPANKCMHKLGQKNVSFAGIFDVLSSKPVLNKLTTYTALMQVNSGHLESWLQYCPDPCQPW